MIGLGGDTNASQVVLSSSSTDTKLITKGPKKNTEGKRCYMIPIAGLSKVFIQIIFHECVNTFILLQACRFSLYSVFGVDESESDSEGNSSKESDSTEVTRINGTAE